MTRYAIIDLPNLFHRARHAANGDAELQAGMALHVIFRSLRKVHRDYKADHFVFCVDGGSWRTDIYPAYKAQRRLRRANRTPAERAEDAVLNTALDDLTAFLADHTRSTVLSARAIEADDFVARWLALHPRDEHVVVSGDSDFVQLLAPNISIYDGVNDRLITQTEVRGPDGLRLAFKVDTSTGRIKVGAPDPHFVPEDEWWRKALFLKIVRGDAGDGVFSAYPGVRYEGSSRRVGIREAWADRAEKGYHWNNFMLQRWKKMIRTGSEEPVFEEVVVRDEFLRNEVLIDLTRQPDEIKQSVDDAIGSALAKPQPSAVGVHFLRFCGKHHLPNIAREAADHAAYLNAGYSLGALSA